MDLDRTRSTTEELKKKLYMGLLLRPILRILALLVSTGAAVASTFDAVSDFSSSNPSGPWAYGTGTVGTSFTPMTIFSNGCNGGVGVSCWQPSSIVNGVPAVLRNNSGATINNGTVVVPSGVLDVHPGPSVDTVVEWMAPSDGTYKISGFFELLDVSPSGVITSIYDGSTKLFTSTLTGPGAMHPNTVGESQSFSLLETLTAGTIIEFGVNNDGNYLFDSTGFDATIIPASSAPEPSSILLLGAGGVIGLCCSIIGRSKTHR